MPDISMCQNKSCPSRRECFRYMAEPNPYRQAYMSFKVDMEDRCSSFVDASKYPHYAMRTVNESKALESSDDNADDCIR